MKEETIVFANDLKNNIVNRSLCKSVKVKKELGKYLQGQSYTVELQNGSKLPYRAIIEKVTRVTVKELDKHIPIKDVNDLIKKKSLSSSNKCDLIEFSIVGINKKEM